MTEAATDTAAAPATPAPDGNAQATQAATQKATQTTDTQTTPEPSGDTSTTNTTPEFSVPEAYKEKSWASKIKSEEDLYKQIDNLTGLVGKKAIAPIDFESATPEEINQYYGSLAPADVSEYDFGENADPDFSGKVAEVFKEYGINKHQASGLASKINEIAASMHEANTDADGYMSMMKESFGDQYEQSVGIVEKALKEYAGDADKAVFDAVDNSTRAAVDRTVHNLVKDYEGKIAALKKEYGVTETGAQTEGEKGGTEVKSAEEKRAEIRAQIRELDGKPFGFEKKARLQAELNKLL